MDPNRRITRSTSNARRNPAETEGTYWGRVIDPTDIERGQVEVIRVVRRATSEDPTALLNMTQDAQQSQPANNNQRSSSIMDDEVPNNLLEEEIPFTSNLTNYTEQSLQLVNAMRKAFVNNSPSTTGSTECMTTPVDMNMLEIDGPLDPAFMTTRCSAALQIDLEQEQQTNVIQLAGVGMTNTIPLPPIPLLPEPDAYIQQRDAMTLNMRRNYVRDRTQAALTYISEYETAQKWEGDLQYDEQQVRQ